MNQPDRIYGIDLGTTNSCIAYQDEKTGSVVVVTNEHGNPVTPSVIYFQSSQTVMVGEEAKEAALELPELTAQEVKLSMGTNFELNIHDTPYRAEDISAIILRKLADQAPADSPVTDVVITVPADFTAEERAATISAGKIANLNVHTLLPEPNAAAIAYSADSDTDETVLVYDLGGGTFDVTVVDITKSAVRAICTAGDHKWGGKQWDEAVVRHLIHEWQIQNRREDEEPGSLLRDPQTNQSFRTAAEEAKKALTTESRYQARVSHRGVHATVEVTRQRFDILTRALLGQTVRTTQGVMNIASDKGYRDISRILLVGGSTRMPQVRARLEQEFNLPVLLYDPDQAVAKGAAIFAANKRLKGGFEQTAEELFGQVEQLSPEQVEAAVDHMRTKGFLPPDTPTIQVEDELNVDYVNISSKNFGIVFLDPESGNLKTRYMIKKNSPVGFTVRDVFATPQDNMSAVRIRVVESNKDKVETEEDMPLPSQAKEIGGFSFPLPPGLPKQTDIRISYFLSEDGGLLEIHAQETRHNTEIKETVNLTDALTQVEVDERAKHINGIHVT